jgi:hypothetical protein
MNFITCPSCNNQCSPLVLSCPECGHPFTGKEFIPASPKAKTNNSLKWKILAIIGISAVGIIAMGLVSFAIYKIVNDWRSNPELERELSDAAYNGDIKKMKELIESGVEVNTSVYKTGTPLVLAILYAAPKSLYDSPSDYKRIIRLGMVKLLLDNGADISKGNDVGTPLSIARITDDDKELEEMLLRAGADPNAVAKEGWQEKPLKINAASFALMYALEAEAAAKERQKKEK